MRVFISHAFGGGDEDLAGTLKKDLAAAGLDGYMAEKEQRYDLFIGDKIRQEIGESDWLVAIITKRGHASASVHEEIGYALGRGTKVALMVEKGVDRGGVLVYGREPEVFVTHKFGAHSKKMAEFIRSSPRPAPRQSPLGKTAKNFLERRRILRHESPEFAKNEHFSRLHNPLAGDDKKPVVLFTACPGDLGCDADVTAREFSEWVETTASVRVDGRQVRVLGREPSVDIGRLLAIERYAEASTRRDVLAYREFQASGFFEFGTSHILFGRNGRKRTALHLCYAVGEFWSFLSQARLFYRKIGLDAPFTAFVSIRNSDALDLGNHGDEVLDSPPYGQPPPAPGRGRRRGPVRHVRAPRLSHGRLPFGPGNPTTSRRNISLRHGFRSASEAADEDIARAAWEAAKHICNAYGETTPRCYDKNGSFSWGLWDSAAQEAARGDLP